MTGRRRGAAGDQPETVPPLAEGSEASTGPEGPAPSEPQHEERAPSGATTSTSGTHPG